MADGIVSVNKNLQKHLLEKGIVPRKDTGPGLWMSFLLPTAVILGELRHSTGSLKYRVATCICCGFFAHSCLIASQAKKYHFWKNFTSVPSVCISTALLYFFTNEGLMLSWLYGVIGCVGYDALVIPVMRLSPGSLTYGETTLLSQAFLIMLTTTVVRTPPSPDCFHVATTILQVGLLCVVGLCAVFYRLELGGRPLHVLGLSASCFLFVLLPVLHALLEMSPLLWIFDLVVHQVTLMGYWCGWVALCAVGIWVRIRLGRKAGSISRKLFHLVVSGVFVPGLLVDPCLLHLASGVALAALVSLDTLRLLRLAPALDTAFKLLADERDPIFSLTPLCLLAGVSLPLWLHPRPLDPDQFLTLLAGVLPVGIGDSAASLIGNLVGRNKWPGSEKTKEGSAACFLSQLFVVIALIHYGYVPRTNLIRPTFAIALVSLIEAKTDQIDNLALPFVMYIFIV